MSVAELARLIGGRVAIRATDELVINVEVLDVRQAWGRTDIKVTPISGAGEQWISADRIVKFGEGR